MVRYLLFMADPEQLAILKKGLDAWNQWRKNNLGLHPNRIKVDLNGVYLKGTNLSQADLSCVDLIEADLRVADLSQADLSWADLTSAKLSGANLSQANLYGANLRGEVDLRGANLTRADLMWADLRQADLSEADFGGADLSNADLSEADLSGADLTATKFSWTTVGNVDLRQVKGLNDVEHRGPSTIGIDTIYRSNGEIPEPFLRGCGVPETFITFIRSLVGHPIEFYSCFISYSGKDQGFAARLHADLQAQHLRVWFAPEDLKIGDRFQERIEESIRLYDKVMIVLSEASVQSPWVEREVNAAREREERENRAVLFPIRIDDAVMSAPQPWAADIRREPAHRRFQGMERPRQLPEGVSAIAARSCSDTDRQALGQACA
jgi:hypothetical protein